MSLLTVNPAAAAPNVTTVALVKPVPVMVSWVPPLAGPVAVEMLLTTGAAT